MYAGLRNAALRVAVAVVALAGGGPASAGVQERKIEVMSELVFQWPRRFRGEALEVIDCETGGTFDPKARSPNGLYFGLFQQGAWARRTYGFAWTIRKQVGSGWTQFRKNGYCWTCNSQWPVCGRGLD